jgi:hypothetical protein
MAVERCECKRGRGDRFWLVYDQIAEPVGQKAMQVLLFAAHHQTHARVHPSRRQRAFEVARKVTAEQYNRPALGKTGPQQYFGPAKVPNNQPLDLGLELRVRREVDRVDRHTITVQRAQTLPTDATQAAYKHRSHG